MLVVTMSVRPLTSSLQHFLLIRVLYYNCYVRRHIVRSLFDKENANPAGFRLQFLKHLKRRVTACHKCRHSTGSLRTGNSVIHVLKSTAEQRLQYGKGKFKQRNPPKLGSLSKVNHQAGKFEQRKPPKLEVKRRITTKAGKFKQRKPLKQGSLSKETNKSS